MKSGQTLAFRLVRQIAAALVGACCLQAAAAAQDAAGSADPDAVARANWRTAMAHNPASPEGCFHAAYPSVVWEAVTCHVLHPLVHPVFHKPTSGAKFVTGNGNDYVAEAAGLISETLGSFPSVSDIKTIKSAGVAAFGDGGILGANEYSLQLNTNFTGTTSVCAGHSGCTVWQQFIYATDYEVKGEAAVFMQYWLIDFGSSRCPSGFESDGEGDCFGNSAAATAPDQAITGLGSFTLSGTAVAGGNDTVVFNSGTEAYSITGKDSMLDISAVWKESEFNIVGDAGGSRADFNSGASVTVKVALTDGSTSAPTCVADDGTTGETNNLNLGSCTATAAASPFIEFTESD
jgi:hypothetical protein